MKATEQYFPVVLFIVLYKVVLPFESVDEIPRYDHWVKAIAQYLLIYVHLCSVVQGPSELEPSVTLKSETTEQYLPLIFKSG